MLQTLHSFLVLLFAIVYLILGLVYMLIQQIVGLFSKKAKERMAYGYMHVGLNVVWHLTGVKLTVIGRENLPKADQPVLYVCNHRSIFDVIIGMTVYPGRVGCVAKDSLGKIPLLSYWMKQINCLFLDRTDIKAGVQMIQDAVALIKSGHSILIFPEGTRNHNEGTLLPMHGGSFKIAIRAGVPVVPVCMCNTGDVFEDHFPKCHGAKVTMVIGEPIDTKTLPIKERKELPERCAAFMQQCLDKYDILPKVPLPETKEETKETTDESKEHNDSKKL